MNDEWFDETKRVAAQYDKLARQAAEAIEVPQRFTGVTSEGIKTRQFDTGATRDSDEGKHDPEGFLSPMVINRFNEYMHKHRHQSDGKLRDSDNWQKGMPLNAYMKSAWRHFLDWWALHRKLRGPSSDDLEETLCAMLFNTSGYLHEVLKARNYMEGAEIKDA